MPVAWHSRDRNNSCTRRWLWTWIVRLGHLVIRVEHRIDLGKKISRDVQDAIKNALRNIFITRISRGFHFKFVKRVSVQGKAEVQSLSQGAYQIPLRGRYPHAVLHRLLQYYYRCCISIILIPKCIIGNLYQLFHFRSYPFYLTILILFPAPIGFQLLTGGKFCKKVFLCF